MSILCTIGGHEADRSETYNSGYYFSRCRRCRCDMVRAGAAWQLAPRGHRVVWKTGRHSHSVEPDYRAATPILHPQANLPAVRPTFASWSRQLVRVPAASAASTPSPRFAEAARVLEREETGYPRLLVIAALAAAGLQLLLSFGGTRNSFG